MLALDVSFAPVWIRLYVLERIESSYLGVPADPRTRGGYSQGIGLADINFPRETSQQRKT